MKKKHVANWVIAILAGILFAAYSAYNIFVLIRDFDRSLTVEGKIISAVVALLFAVLASAAWTTEVKNLRFRAVLRTVFSITVILIFALKQRMIGRVIAYLDLSKFATVLYGLAYLMTQAALLLLLIYYLFIRKSVPLEPKSSVFLPVLAMILFLCSLAAEMILLFVYHIGLEGNPLRTVVSRPIFYMSFVGLCVYFLIPPNRDDVPITQALKDELLIPPAETRQPDIRQNPEKPYDDTVVRPAETRQPDIRQNPEKPYDDTVVRPAETRQPDVRQNPEKPYDDTVVRPAETRQPDVRQNPEKPYDDTLIRPAETRQPDIRQNPEKPYDDTLIRPVATRQPDVKLNPNALEDELVIMPAETRQPDIKQNPDAPYDDTVVTEEHPL